MNIAAQPIVLEDKYESDVYEDDDDDDYDYSSDDSGLSQSDPLEGLFELEKFENKIDVKTEEKSIQIPKKIQRLPIIEEIFYIIAFTSGAVYSLYKFYTTSQRWGQYLSLSTVDNSWFGKRVDVADLEWYVWPSALSKVTPWALVHFILAQVIRNQYIDGLPIFYTVFSSCFLVYLIGVYGTFLCFMVPVVMFIVLMTRLKLLVWLTWCLILVFFNTIFFENIVERLVNGIPEGDYMVSVIIAWFILRSLSLCLDTCDIDPDGEISNKSLLPKMLCYCFYLPCLMTGPYLPYIDFHKGLQKKFQAWTIERIKDVILEFIFYSFWFMFTNTLLYYFYAHSLNFMPHLVSKMSSWSLAGFTYYLIVFFNSKYLVLYGFSIVLARMEGYDTPNPPECCVIMYKFSDVWRYFDQGLYRFMINHIYVPWVSENKTLIRKLQATALVFTFVYVWHGVTPQVFWWSFINFIGVVFEQIAGLISQNPSYLQWEATWLPGAWARRFHGALAVLLFVPSINALIIFLSSLENAIVIAKRIFYIGFPTVTASTFFFLYCLVQCSMLFRNWKARSTSKLKSN